MSKTLKNTNETDFSLALGGPLYQLYQRLFLLKPPLDLLKRRIIAITLFTWLPLLLLAFFGGVAISDVKVPFLFDFETHIRFLVALTLLIAGEWNLHEYILRIVKQFSERDIITQETHKRFEHIKASTMQLRNSILVEVFLIVFVYTIGHFIWQEYMSFDANTWYTTIMNGQAQLTPAGYWYSFVSIPIFQFIFLRWYFRLFVWYRFLWQVSHLPIRLNALHPDQAGGLGFLALSTFAFAPWVLAHSILLAGLIINRIWHAGQTLLEFKFEMISCVMILLLLVLIPLLFFLPLMARTKRLGMLDYGMVASHYVNEFRKKWIDTHYKIENTMLGSSDIQSLADLSNSFNVTCDMGIVPFNRKTIIQLIVLIALPLFPLFLTMIPLSEMISRAIQLII